MPEVFKGVVQAEHFGEHPDFGAGTAVYGKGQDGYLLCPELKLIAVADGGAQCRGAYIFSRSWHRLGAVAIGPLEHDP